MKTTVWVTTTFVGYHRWKDAPDRVKFLRDFHRHVFHVKLGVPVNNLNREVEFFTLKEGVNQFIKDNYENRHFEQSCEMIAQHLMLQFDAAFVEVSEDSENGARVEQ